MKKLTSIILAIITAVCTALSASAAGAPRAALGRIKSVSLENEVFVLNRSVSISKPLDVAEGEFLAIPSGMTLYLKKGASIDGGIYVEKGGKLVFAGGGVTINGSIVSDGKVTLKSGVSADIYGSVYVSSAGTLSIGSDEKFIVYDSRGGKVACLGKTNSKLLEIAKTPIAAVLVKTDIGGIIIETQTIAEDLEAAFPDPDKYYTDEETLIGAITSTLYVFFDNGVCISADKLGIEANGERYTYICDVSVRGAKIAINSLGDI